MQRRGGHHGRGLTRTLHGVDGDCDDVPLTDVRDLSPRRLPWPVVLVVEAPAALVEAPPAAPQRSQTPGVVLDNAV